MRKLLYLGVPVAFLVVGLYLWEGSPVYIGEPIEGWVVDADTRMPLEGVVVVAAWFKEAVWGFHPHTVGPVMVLEAVTDAHGHFRISGWGPTFRGWGAPEYDDPQLLLWKSRYDPRAVGNVFPASPWVIRRRSDWNWQVIELTLYKGSLDTYARDIEDLDTTNIENIAFRGTCWFRNIPRTLVALEMEKHRLEDELHRRLFFGRSLDLPEDPKTRANCGAGSIRAAVNGYIHD